MIAVIGIPGSVHHDYAWFPRHGTTSGETAAQWIERVYRETLDRNPALGTIATEILSDRKAKAQYYRDGTAVYDVEAGRAGRLPPFRFDDGPLGR